MGILGNLLFRGGADENTGIPILVEHGALIIDTRTADEFAAGHIEGAINLPYNVIGNAIKDHEPLHTRSIIVYCHSGARSAAAKKNVGQSRLYPCCQRWRVAPYETRAWPIDFCGRLHFYANLPSS